MKSVFSEAIPFNSGYLQGGKKKEIRERDGRASEKWDYISWGITKEGHMGTLSHGRTKITREEK